MIMIMILLVSMIYITKYDYDHDLHHRQVSWQHVCQHATWAPGLATRNGRRGLDGAAMVLL